MVQIEKSKKQLYQFSGWVEEINNWKKQQRVLKRVHIVQNMQEIHLDLFQQPHKKMHEKPESRGAKYQIKIDKKSDLSPGSSFFF